MKFENNVIGYAISNKTFNYEIDVWVHVDHRRKGFALMLCTKLIEHCLREGITPHWDAANRGSVLLAQKLGFTSPKPYTIFLVNKNLSIYQSV